jgi:hypothetical protein
MYLWKIQMYGKYNLKTFKTGLKEGLNYWLHNKVPVFLWCRRHFAFNRKITAVVSFHQFWWFVSSDFVFCNAFFTSDGIWSLLICVLKAHLLDKAWYFSKWHILYIESHIMCTFWTSSVYVYYMNMRVGSVNFAFISIWR